MTLTSILDLNISSPSPIGRDLHTSRFFFCSLAQNVTKLSMADMVLLLAQNLQQAITCMAWFRLGKLMIILPLCLRVPY
jgi:hypothetical protein